MYGSEGKEDNCSIFFSHTRIVQHGYYVMQEASEYYPAIFFFQTGLFHSFEKESIHTVFQILNRSIMGCTLRFGWCQTSLSAVIVLLINMNIPQLVQNFNI